MDGWLVLAASLLTLVGLLSLWSIDAAVGTDFFKRQMVRIAIGVVPFAIFLLVRPATWRRLATPMYIVNLAMLASVLLIGDTRNNAQRWLQIGPLDFQPSELAKLLVVLTVSSFLASRMDQIRTLKVFALSFLHVAIPMALIYKQPHLGSTLVVGAAWLTICWVAGARLRYVVGSIVLAMGVLTAAFFIPGAMSEYQKGRIVGFLKPDKSGDGYQVYRGLVAIGSGGLDGKGYLKGEQKGLKFIPFQQTDFIFTVIGEEGGLVGGFIVLALFGLLFFRTWLIVHLSADPFHRMLGAGVLAIFAFHMTANLGMVLQLLPVVGLWLPLMSYGGTAMWLCMACIALMLNVRSQEERQEF